MTVQDERQALLRSPSASSSETTVNVNDATNRDTSGNYGAVEDGSIQKKEDVKVYKTFREIWPIFLGLTFAVFCGALGMTIVANLTIEIGSHFHAGSLASWLGTGFLLGLTAMTPLYGRLAQVMGRKGVMLLAVSLYLVGTIMCAVAPSMGFMIAARIVAGAGSGGILTVSAIIISDLVSLADRGVYQGGTNLLFGAGSALGAVVGGAISDKWGWRAAFWIQVPPVVLSLLLIIWKVNVDREKGEDLGGDSVWDKIKGIDWSGSVLLMFSISAFSTSSSLWTSSHYPLNHPFPLTLFVAGLVAFPLFIWVEKKALHPILPLTMLSRAQPRLILVGFFLTTLSNFSRLYMQPVYLHVTRGLNGSETGLLLLPSSIVGSFSSLYAGWHMRHWREYKWFQAFASFIPWIQALSLTIFWGPNTDKNELWIEMAFGALGGGITITTLLTSLIACVEPSELSLAISACYLSRALGQVIGLSISACIQQIVLFSSLTSRFPDNMELVRQLIQEPSEILPTLDPLSSLQAKLAYLDSIRSVFVFVILGGICLSAVSLSVRGKRL
ncbi:uncharacterized protein I303_106546 [Kwoniella dejecticola CBS 10117]|uniref:Major facilitator superfamily (MFS) profile domain-containing protein n=1 Tax=Kwoniella dejecticola CBS 10117 TaxID=1296121 RepID=A0A1A5ZUE2_9TREE|nr:uncharacterized protein I303_08197 [Kwoniella dejecticola CBS 10117]OBR81427.1 hypothetical protein I303_08197 [Kwoniella dejecticola CBS 10117]